MNTCCIYCPTSSLPFPDGGFFGRKKLSTLGPCDLIGTDPNLWNHIWPTKDSISLNTVIASELDKWPKSANEWQWWELSWNFWERESLQGWKCNSLCLGLPAAILTMKEPAWSWHANTEESRPKEQRQVPGAIKYWIQLCLKPVVFLEPMYSLSFKPVGVRFLSFTSSGPD